MESSAKIIDLSQLQDSYSISSSDTQQYIVIKGDVTLQKNTAIVFDGNAPIHTILQFIFNGAVNTAGFTFTLLGQKLSSNLANYCDMVIAHKRSTDNNAQAWKRIFIMSTEIGVGSKIIAPQGDMSEPYSETKRIAVDTASIVDTSTLVEKDGKLTALIPSADRYVDNDDFLSTNKLLSNTALTGESLGVVQMNGTPEDNSASILSAQPIVKLERTPSFEAFVKINLRGNSRIMLGFIDDLSYTKGVYFLLEGTTNEVFTVINDGTERKQNSGISVSLSQYVKFRIVVSAQGVPVFYINDVVVPNMAYSVPFEAYYDAIIMQNVTSSSTLSVDYVKIEMNRG